MTELRYYVAGKKAAPAEDVPADEMDINAKKAAGGKAGGVHIEYGATIQCSMDCPHLATACPPFHTWIGCHVKRLFCAECCIVNRVLQYCCG